MCLEIYYKGEWLETIGDAMRVIGAEKMVMAGGYPLSFLRAGDIEKSCLCPLDGRATAEALGCTMERYGGEWAFVAKEPPQ